MLVFVYASSEPEQLELLIDLSSFFISYYTMLILNSTLTHIGDEMLVAAASYVILFHFLISTVLHIFRQLYAMRTCDPPTRLCLFAFGWNLRCTYIIYIAKIERLNLCSKAFLQIESDKEKTHCYNTELQHYVYKNSCILCI